MDTIQAAGRIWKFGNNIDTDMIIATQFLIEEMDLMKTRTFAVVDENFALEFRPGDIIVGGRNFGCGSSRQQAVDVFNALGVGAIIAESFARIFYRNSINLGLPLIELKEAVLLADRSEAVVEIGPLRVVVINGGRTYEATPFPDFILELLKKNRRDR